MASERSTDVQAFIGALDGGVTRSLRVDMHGKTLGYALLEMEI